MELGFKFVDFGFSVYVYKFYRLKLSIRLVFFEFLNFNVK